MKFIKLESRGGNYLVVAENVAWLRTAENGQTNVGIIGGQPLLVVGSIEEVAAKILAGVNGEDGEEAAPAPAPTAAPPPVPVVAPAPVAIEDQTEAEAVAPLADPRSAPEPEPQPEPQPQPQSEALPDPQPAPPPLHLGPRPAAPVPARPRPAMGAAASLWERPAAPAAKGLKIKASSQRMMGLLE